MNLPSGFRVQMERLLGGESDDFFTALTGEPSVSIRLNPFKMREYSGGSRVAWCEEGFMLPERPNFTMDPLLHAGAYYVQEPSSMFVGHLVRSAFGSCKGLRMLDMCASPGGKATLLSTLAGPGGLVVANEAIRSRTGALVDNIVRWGIGNTVVTCNDPAHFGALGPCFDLVLVDAPCSGEGMFRKNPHAAGQWSEEAVQMCARRQRRILSDAWEALRPSGVMIYSTCTFNEAENESNIGWLAENFGCERVEVATDESWGIVRGSAGGIETFRFYPHRVSGEGFFAAVLRKKQQPRYSKLPPPRRISPIAVASRRQAGILSAWVDRHMRFASIGERMFGFGGDSYDDVHRLAARLNVIYSGVSMGRIFGSQLRPDHALALFTGLERSAARSVELGSEGAAAYLRKDSLRTSLFEEGLSLVTCRGLPLGWINRTGNRLNNTYPGRLRIVKR